MSLKKKDPFGYTIVWGIREPAYHVALGRGTPNPATSKDADSVSNVSTSLSIPDNILGYSVTKQRITFRRCAYIHERGHEQVKRGKVQARFQNAQKPRVKLTYRFKKPVNDRLKVSLLRGLLKI